MKPHDKNPIEGGPRSLRFINVSITLAKVLIHIVYSTKNRAPFLRNVSVRKELYAYIAAVLRDKGDSPAIRINGTEDHLHIFCELSRKLPIMDIVKISKTEGAKWLKKQQATLRTLQWQAGYGVFSVSVSNVERVKIYINDQETHHRKLTFQDEFREICRRHGVPFDERFVWE